MIDFLAVASNDNVKDLEHWVVRSFQLSSPRHTEESLMLVRLVCGEPRMVQSGMKPNFIWVFFQNEEEAQRYENQFIGLIGEQA